MARRKQKPRKNKPQTEAQRLDDVVRDTAAHFTCSAKVIQDFLDQCESRLEQTECDLAFNRVAHEIWRDRSGPAQEIAAALESFVDERARHLAALTEIAARLGALSTAQASEEHQHLDPVERYRDLIRQRIFPDEP